VRTQTRHPGRPASTRIPADRLVFRRRTEVPANAETSQFTMTINAGRIARDGLTQDSSSTPGRRREASTNRSTCTHRGDFSAQPTAERRLRIVSDDLWNAVVSKAARQAGRGLMRGKNAALHSRHLFSGFMRCGSCGGAITVVSGGYGQPRYGCLRRSKNAPARAPHCPHRGWLRNVDGPARRARARHVASVLRGMSDSLVSSAADRQQGVTQFLDVYRFNRRAWCQGRICERWWG